MDPLAQVKTREAAIALEGHDCKSRVEDYCHLGYKQ